MIKTMQYVRKEDVFNQDMSVKTMEYQASTLFFSVILMYTIYMIYIYTYVACIYIIYKYRLLYTFFHFLSFFFSVIFLSQNYYYKSAYSRSLTFL